MRDAKILREKLDHIKKLREDPRTELEVLEVDAMN